MPDQGGGGLANLTCAALSWLSLDRHNDDGRFAARASASASEDPQTGPTWRRYAG